MAISFARPEQYTGTQGANALRSDFFQNNSWDDSYKDFIPEVKNYASQFLNKADPLAGGAAGFRSTFGFSSLDPDDPRIPKFQGNLLGAQRLATQDASERLANAGVNASRGGMGLAGGPNFRSNVINDANRTIAGNAGQAYGQAVNWTRDAVGQGNEAASAAANIYGKQLDTGQAMMGLMLDALKSGNMDKFNWAKLQYDAYQADIEETNKLRQGQRTFDWQAADRQRQLGQENEARYQGVNRDNMIRQINTQPRGSNLMDTTNQMMSKLLWDPTYAGAMQAKR